MLCCESTTDERSAGNPHATFCGSRGLRPPATRWDGDSRSLPLSTGQKPAPPPPFPLHRVFPSTARVYLLPLSTVGLPDVHRLYRPRIKTPSIDTEAVRM